jgi:hypothetical protein
MISKKTKKKNYSDTRGLMQPPHYERERKREIEKERERERNRSNAFERETFCLHFKNSSKMTTNAKKIRSVRNHRKM